MSSELHGSGGDQPARQADKPGESRDDPFNRVPRDINAMPASSGWKPESGISRADYYPQDGDGPARQQPADISRYGTGTGTSDAPATGTDGLDSGTEDGTDDGQLEGTEPVSGGLEVQEAPAEAAGAGGDPPQGPNDGPDVRSDLPDPGFMPDQARGVPDDEEPGDGPGTVFGRDGVIDAGPAAGIGETGGEEERGDSGAARKARPEAQEQPRQGDAAAADETSARTDDSAEDRESSDQPGEQDQNAEQTRERVQPLQETREETVPDEAADQRMDAFEQRMQSMMEQKLHDALEAAKAEYEAKLEEQSTKHEAEIESIKAEHGAKLADAEARIDELETKAKEGQPTGDFSPDWKPDGGEDPDVSEAEQRGDRPQRGVNDPEHGPDELDNSQDQGTSLGEHEELDHKAEGKKADSPRWRGVLTSENISATGTVGGTINTVALFAMHATPEAGVTVGLTILGLAGLVKAKVEKHRKESDERPD